MKIIAIEKEIPGVDWEGMDEILKQEALHVYELYEKNVLREIYLTENNNAILILEVDDLKEANLLLVEFPLVREGMIKFDIHELRPYRGINRLIK